MRLAEEPSFTLGRARVNPPEREVAHSGGREILEPKVMEVLIVLARGAGRVVSRDELIEACWGGRAVTDDAINRVISRLRKLSELIGEGGFTLETITKVGYRMSVAAEGAAEPAAAEAGGVGGAAHPSAPAVAAHGPALFARLRKTSIWGAVAAVIILLGAAAVWFWPVPKVETPPDNSMTLAVLAFSDIAGGADALMLDALPREIRSRLSRVRGLRVIADTSSFALAGEALGPSALAERLGADLLVMGSVQRVGERERVRTELVDGKAGTILWTGEFEGERGDVVGADAKLSSELLEHLLSVLGAERTDLTVSRGTSDPQTHRLLLEAQLLRQKLAEASMASNVEESLTAADQVEAKLKEILARDPGNSDALEVLANLVVRGMTRAMSEARLTVFERRAQAANLLREAIRSNPDNPAALTALAEQYRRFDWRWTEADTLFRRALAIDPNFAPAHAYLSYHLSVMGRCVEGLGHARQAAALDPLSPWARLVIPRMLKCTGDLAQSDRLYMQEMAGKPGNVFLAREIYIGLLSRSRPGDIRALADRIEKDFWQGAPPASMAESLARMRLGADALEGRGDALMAQVEREAAEYGALDPTTPPIVQGRLTPDLLWTLAIEAAAAGRTERAIELLEAAIGGRSLYIPETFPYGLGEFTPEMRAHPRYQRIWRSQPALVELVEARRRAIEQGLGAGVLPGGRVVVPGQEG